MLIMREFQCQDCKATKEDLVDSTNPITTDCPKCGSFNLVPCLGIPTGSSIPTVTIPTYPGCKRRKAGYQHKYVNRPATKTQVGVGGGVSKGEEK